MPAAQDAACLAGARAAGARIVGRTNLHELALGVTGVNQWYGTPVNPLDPTRVPGGSSSGSAVAVATGEADVAYGSDTGGSVRIPAACCGTAGLKTTWGRIPLEGVWPLAPSFDTVGPMARDVAGLVTGMQLLEPGFTVADVGGADLTVGRLGVEADPAITAAIDRALDLVGWDRARPGGPRMGRRDHAGRPAPGGRGLGHRRDAGGGGPRGDQRRRAVPARARLGLRRGHGAGRLAVQRAWKATLEQIFTEVDILVTPTLSIFPPRLEDGDDLLVARCTLPVNLAGVPALSLPVPSAGRCPPASS